jgi:hypothetical protein
MTKTSLDRVSGDPTPIAHGSNRATLDESVRRWPSTPVAEGGTAKLDDSWNEVLDAAAAYAQSVGYARVLARLRVSSDC